MIGDKNITTSAQINLSPDYTFNVVQDLVYMRLKRLLDLTISIIVLVGLAPLMVIVAIAIRLDSPGPLIFQQERVGSRLRNRNGIYYWERYNFTFYKFRSMYTGSSDAIHRQFTQALILEDDDTMEILQDGKVSGGSKYKLQNDKRITRVGRILRKTSLDELPQLWNVIIGNMSLVGPRPPLPYEVEVYSPRHLQRLGTQPGITGLWQVTARSSVSFDEMVELDLEYIRKQSLLLDLNILLRTIFVLFDHKGAL